MSQSSWYRYLEQANKYLETFSEIEKVDMFVKIVSHGKFELEKIGVSVDEMSVKEFLQLRLSKWSEFQLRSIVESLESIHLKAGEPSLLLKELLSPLFSSKFHLALLEKGGVQVDEKFLGKEQRAVIVAGRLARDIPNKRRDSHEYSKVSVDHMINTIKLTGLSSEVHGDNLILARSVQCCWRYAQKILKAVTTGSEESLYTRMPWTGAIKGTEWPVLLQRTVGPTLVEIWYQLVGICQRCRNEF